MWFAAVTTAVSSLVFPLCAILELIERYDLFKDSRIQLKVSDKWVVILISYGCLFF